MKFGRVSCPAMLFFWFVAVSGSAVGGSSGHYRAAVYEHSRLGDEYADNSTAVIEANLDCYQTASETARQKGADIIVFPEYGIFAPLNRSQIKPYLEAIPNPKEVNANPCDEPESFGNRPVLSALSCMAKANGIVLVANMGGIESCQGKDGCPEDGDLHLNANVAFDRNGTLVGRYYKERLFFELGMDLPREEQDPVFQSELGKFAMFTCFDVIFEKISLTSQRKDVDAVILLTMWMNSSPFYIATQWFQAWAMGNNATFLAANVQMPGHLATGSGIFLGRRGSIGHTLNPDGISKMVVSTVPKDNWNTTSAFEVIAIFKNHTTAEWFDDGQNIPEVCSYATLGPAKNVYKDYRCTNEATTNYTLVKLREPRGHLEACNNYMCCELDYVASAMNETYYLGVYNGTHNSFDRYFWWEESCFLARCDDLNDTACSMFPMTSDTFFHEIHLRANFTSERIYPSVVADRIKLLPTNDWTFATEPGRSSVSAKSSSGIQLLSAGLKGRAYDKDPPYVR